MTSSNPTRIDVHQLKVADSLYQFIEKKVLPKSGVTSKAFWKGFSQIVTDLAPINQQLLAERDRIQTEMDNWHSANPGPITDMAAYQDFLKSIGYLVPVPKNVKVKTKNVDAKIAKYKGNRTVSKFELKIQRNIFV